MEDVKELQELLHQLINKSVTTQILLKILQKSELDEQQKDILQKSIEATEECMLTVKAIREKLR